ncbi:MAG: hypothetical protein R3F61_36870 [Myxococcota bacterium]
MTCPKCGAALNPNLVTSGLGRCQWCDHIWEVGGDAAIPESQRPSVPTATLDPPRGASPEVAAPVGRVRYRPVLPDGMHLDETVDGVVVRIPWRMQAGVVVHLFFWAVGACFFAPLFGFYTMRGYEVFFAAAFLVVYAYLLVNTTEVRIRPDGIQVRHGPLPSLQDKSVDLAASRLALLDVRAEAMYHRGQKTTHYSLWAGQTLVLRKFAEESTVDYVAHVIADVVRTPVEIRYQDH